MHQMLWPTGRPPGPPSGVVRSRRPCSRTGTTSAMRSITAHRAPEGVPPSPRNPTAADPCVRWTNPWCIRMRTSRRAGAIFNAVDQSDALVLTALRGMQRSRQNPAWRPYSPVSGIAGREPHVFDLGDVAPAVRARTVGVGDPVDPGELPGGQAVSRVPDAAWVGGERARSRQHGLGSQPAGADRERGALLVSQLGGEPRVMRQTAALTRS
jgi:hypothetical protein